MMFIRNIPLKVASLFIALVLAYAVQRAGNASVVSLFVPLEVKNTPEDRIIVKPVKRGAQVTLKGPSFIVGPLASSPPSIRVKLPDGVSDRATVAIKPSDISLPPSVEVLSIEPTQVEFVLESLDKQELRVAVPRIGQLAKELVLEGIDVSPSSILVKGPRSELKQLKVIETEPIDLGSISSSTEIVLNLRSMGGSVTPQSKTVLARVAVGEQPTERNFSQVPVEVRIGGRLGLRLQALLQKWTLLLRSNRRLTRGWGDLRIVLAAQPDVGQPLEQAGLLLLGMLGNRLDAVLLGLDLAPHLRRELLDRRDARLTHRGLGGALGHQRQRRLLGGTGMMRILLDIGPRHGCRRRRGWPSWSCWGFPRGRLR
jgi:hypothetical protein